MNPELKIPEFESRNYATVEDYEQRQRELDWEQDSRQRQLAEMTGASDDDVKVIDPAEAHQKAKVFATDYDPRKPNPEPAPTRSKAKQLEANVLRDSLEDAKEALYLISAAVELFNARRDVPQHHKAILVALRDLIAEIETEQAVFNRNDLTTKQG